MKRACACGAYLSQYNRGDECWQCQERERLKRLAPPPEPQEPKPEGNPSGLCKCGCGRKTPLAKQTRAVDNIKIGVPIHYCKGHGNIRRGRTNGNSQLTADLVIQMRREYAEGGTSFRRIAHKYRVGETTVRQAITGKSWSHIEDGLAA